MKAPARGPSGPWILASSAGVVLLGALAFLIRIPQPPGVVPRPTALSVRLVDPIVMGSLLRDPTPLFLPTEFNSSRKTYVPKEDGGAFAGYPARLTYQESELTLQLPALANIPGSPAEALRGEPPGAPFLGFARTDPVMQPLAPRGAYVEIVAASTGRTVFGQPLAAAHPPASPLPWQPMEFIAAVDAAGLVGPLVPTRRSGVDEVDTYFEGYLAQVLRVGQRLAPGFYRISVGP